MPEQSLRITEIFHSLQGETSTTGLPTVFVRLTGCPLRCGYCDTAYAFEGGTKMALSGEFNTELLTKTKQAMEDWLKSKDRLEATKKMLEKEGEFQ